jgi:hypothetical protein
MTSELPSHRICSCVEYQRSFMHIDSDLDSEREDNTIIQMLGQDLQHYDINKVQLFQKYQFNSQQADNQ